MGERGRAATASGAIVSTNEILHLTVRPSRADDADVLASFNLAMADETEGLALVPEVVAEGVRGVFARPDRGFYLVAENEGEVVGALMVTREWSDWRNSDFWWIQSVYVRPDHRRRGVFRSLYAAVRAAALARAGVCGLRLYVEHENREAMRVYAALGMREAAYRMWQDTFA